MKKEMGWLSSRCICSVLVELAKRPGTPMDLRVRTHMTKNNYVNIILKRLESEGIVKCLNPKEKIGKVFCVEPKNKYRLEKLFKKMKINQKINPLPHLNWNAYGILFCRSLCRQIRLVFKEAYKLGNEMDFENNRKKRINVPGLQKEKLTKMATSDIHRAFNRLVKLGLMKRKPVWPKEYIFSKDAFKIIAFDHSVVE
jgi:hypothetical protein